MRDAWTLAGEMPMDHHRRPDMKDTKLIFITCTYNRPLRLAYMRRHIDQIFSKIEDYVWIIVEDNDTPDPAVVSLTANLNVQYMCIGPTKDKGHVQRNLALEYVRDNRLEGVVYIMDDDNLVYRPMVDELRKVTRFATFPVGNLGPHGIERPVVVNGKTVFWSVNWPERPFPIDMGGFAFPSHHLFDQPSPMWTYAGMGGESEFIGRFVASADEMDVSLCHHNRVCLVFHNEPIDSASRMEF